MTRKEKRLLYLMLGIFIFYAVPFELYPRAMTFYQDEVDEIEQLQTQIEKSKRLFQRTEFWQEQNARIKQERIAVYGSLLQGENRDLLVVEIQKLIRELAKKTGMASYSTQDLPTFSENTGDWMFITQKVTFESQSKALVDFLKAVEDAPQKLEVVKLYIYTSPRNKMLRGTVEITGFARSSDIVEEG
ncbi:hypothetical protein [Candidatus Albibeggiatoa sp. nov. NOAA]|uniref:hypothetical protein n=1 Tax=Candidatus Albibeggiatoa sp. nov. NOAA TaxID=3162724 RepID=UPI003304FA15|nr:hypothetical protein [Thiotrichaceae bacterium]